MHFLTKLAVPFLVAGSASAAALPRDTDAHTSTKNGLKYFFSFGASSAQTGFDENSTQPSAGDPMGNPIPPLAYTGGNNYVNFLTTKYNSSLVYNYNFARVGASVSRSVVDPGVNTSTGFDEQVRWRFANKYAKKGQPKIWTSDNSYFSSQFGINDIRFILTRANQSTVENVRIPQILDSWFDSIEFLYQLGARKMLFMTVEPFDRTPRYSNTTYAPVMKQWISDFNGNLTARIDSFRNKHHDAITAIYDDFRLQNAVLDNPQAYGYPANTTASCYNSDGYSCVYWDNFHMGEHFNDILGSRMIKAMNSLGYDGSVPVGGYFY